MKIVYFLMKRLRQSFKWWTKNSIDPLQNLFDCEAFNEK